MFFVVFSLIFCLLFTVSIIPFSIFVCTRFYVFFVDLKNNYVVLSHFIFFVPSFCVKSFAHVFQTKQSNKPKSLSFFFYRKKDSHTQVMAWELFGYLHERIFKGINYRSLRCNICIFRSMGLTSLGSGLVIWIWDIGPIHSC